MNQGNVKIKKYTKKRKLPYLMEQSRLVLPVQPSWLHSKEVNSKCQIIKLLELMKILRKIEQVSRVWLEQKFK